MSQTTETKAAFDFIAEGVGYLNRVREIKPAGRARPARSTSPARSTP